jgi:adenine/guanine phosphoribosyltransferase-like PRPP-binding protein
VLVVDDVVTTGATLRSARSALQRVGADVIGLYAVAATPSGVASIVRPTERRLRLVVDDVAA